MFSTSDRSNSMSVEMTLKNKPLFFKQAKSEFTKITTPQFQSIGSAILALKTKLGQTYSVERLAEVKNDYQNIREMIYKLINSTNKNDKISEEYKISEAYIDVYQHQMQHFPEMIINFLLAHLHKNYKDINAVNFMKEMIEENLKNANCLFNPVLVLKEYMSKRSEKFYPSLKNYSRGLQLTNHLQDIDEYKRLSYLAKIKDLSYLIANFSELLNVIFTLPTVHRTSGLKLIKYFHFSLTEEQEQIILRLLPASERPPYLSVIIHLAPTSISLKSSEINAKKM